MTGAETGVGEVMKSPEGKGRASECSKQVGYVWEKGKVVVKIP